MKRKLGEILISSGVVSQADVDEVLNDQSAGEPARLGDQLIALGRLTSFQLAKALSEQHGLPYMGLPAIPPRVMSVIPLDYQQLHRLVPFRVDADTVSIAVADPSNTDAIEELRYSLNRRIVVSIAPGDEIDSVHAAYASASPPREAVAPVSSNAKGKPKSSSFRSTPTPPPTEAELFGSLDLESVDVAPTAAPAAAKSSQSNLQDLFGDVSLDEQPIVSSPSEEINFGDLSEPGAEDVAVELRDEAAEEAGEAPEVDDFFGNAAPAEVIDDGESIEVSDGFESSSSSLHSLVIEPHVPVLPDRPVAAPPPPPKAATPVVPPAPSGPSLPDWLKSSAPDAPARAAKPAPAPAPAYTRPEPEAEPAPEPAPVAYTWSGRLDDVPPSRLIVATVKALVLNGLVSEEAILEALAKKE